MTIEDSITYHRTRARDCFQWENYQMAREYIQIADWLEELVRARKTIEFLHAEVTSNDCRDF